MRLNTDTVPAMLTPGEGVLNRYAMNLPGVKQFVKKKNLIGNKQAGANPIGNSVNERSNFGNQGIKGYAAGTTGVPAGPVGDDPTDGVKYNPDTEFPFKANLHATTDMSNPQNDPSSAIYQQIMQAGQAARGAWGGTVPTGSSAFGINGIPVDFGGGNPIISGNPLNGTSGGLMTTNLGSLGNDATPFTDGSMSVTPKPPGSQPIFQPPVRVPPAQGFVNKWPPPPIQGLAKGGIVRGYQNGVISIPKMRMTNGTIIPMAGRPSRMPITNVG